MVAKGFGPAESGTLPEDTKASSAYGGVSATKPSGKTGRALVNIFMGTLREIREEIQNIRRSLTKVRDAGTNATEDEREKKLGAAWSENQEIVKKNVQQITILFKKFPVEIYPSDPHGPCVYDRFCDDVTRIDNQWERFRHLWQKYGVSPKDLQGHYEDLNTLLCDMIYEINTLTIPDRINEHFETMYPGQELDFDANFGNELCKKEHATPILKYIDGHPACICGIVDVAKGKVYKVDPDPGRRAVSFVVTGLILITGFVVALLLPWFMALMKFPLSIAVPSMTVANATVTTVDFSTVDLPVLNTVGFFLCACYFVLVIGGLAHLLIGGVKQTKSAEPGSLLALEGWLRWFHIKEQQNWAAAFFLLIGFAGMLFILKTADYATAFLIGYSIDSFVDLFLTRFDVTVTAKTEEIKKKIPKEGAEPAT